MKQKLYPKTRRVTPSKIKITEKLDGSNIGFFKLDNVLYVAQRNNIYSWEEIKTCNKDDLYKGLSVWLEEHGQELLDSLYDGSGFFGEWIGMDTLKYEFENKVFMFAKMNVRHDTTNSELEAYNIYWEERLFKYPFVDQTIPSFISIVPTVAEVADASLIVLNKIYDEYCDEVGRPVEGFIVVYNADSIKKYVRVKRGTMKDHFWQEE